MGTNFWKGGVVLTSLLLFCGRHIQRQPITLLCEGTDTRIMSLPFDCETRKPSRSRVATVLSVCSWWRGEECSTL